MQREHQCADVIHVATLAKVHLSHGQIAHKAVVDVKRRFLFVANNGHTNLFAREQLIVERVEIAVARETNLACNGVGKIKMRVAELEQYRSTRLLLRLDIKTNAIVPTNLRYLLHGIGGDGRLFQHRSRGIIAGVVHARRFA